MSAFPPHRSIDSIPVTQEIALTYLQTYLTATKTSPYLLPNARLEPSGPTAGSSNSSVTIHNLQRVEAGLRGEWLAPKFGLDHPSVEVAQGMDDGTNKNGEGNREGWMDLDQYQREQSIEGPEQAQEETAAEDGDEVEDEGEGRIEAAGEELQEPAAKKQKMGDYGTTKAPVDKASRKREKKERQKAEKKARQQSKQTAVEV